ncbi:probable cytochrome P450 311a1 isoform X1 [Drosophila ananassae]|uniref:probable cytochrome P450 311a1 isoform X1 n=2 Tax=Drosophila ananassae TaxID=7217 RepID=UPI0013A5D30C|nr:probable cytochrome P450 311a1 isoform X1 [Drosophila ananassae]
MALWPLVLFTLGLWLLIRKWPLLRLGMSLAGPWAFPLLGNAQMVGKLKPEFIFLVFTELRDRFGATYRLWLGPQLWVFLHSAEETRQALHDPTLRKAETFLQLEPLIGNGLLISHGAHWTRQRRLMTPAFQPNILRGFAPAVARHVDALILKLEANKGASLEVTDPLFACLLDAIVETSMGAQLNTQSQDHSPVVLAFHRSSELLFKRMINPLLASDWIFRRTQLWRDLREQLQVIHTLMDSVIDRRARDLEKEMGDSPGKAHNLLDTLLLAKFNGESLSRKEIRDEVNTFVFAGVDTTTAAMSFVVYALAKYPSAQTRLREEIQQLQASELENIDALNELPYLEALLKEVLRLYTIVPTTGRQTTQNTVIGGRSYCPGITLWINMYGLAHDKEYYPDPYSFKPERWLDQEDPPPPFSYIPFSGGPHVCIGRRYSLLLMKLLTARLVREFHLELGPLQAPLKLQAQMVLKSQEGIHVCFKKYEILNK